MGFRDATIEGSTVSVPHISRRLEPGESGRLLLTISPMAEALERVEERDLECGHIIARFTFRDAFLAVLFWQSLRRCHEASEGCSQTERPK